jgi:UDP-2-acetamido-3-amino-2,3-dideoxy-glucuronate N-acetyltransferase
MNVKVHPTAEIEAGVSLGDSTQVWHYCQIRRDARLGAECKLGKNVFVDFEVTIGDRCKIQNNCSLYHGAEVGHGVFIGPHVVLLNDKNPRAVNPDGTVKDASDWTVQGVRIGDGTSIGGRATLLPGVKIGDWAMVGAGSVVTRDVPDYGLVYGNPARLHGYVDRVGNVLKPSGRDGSNDLYELPDGTTARAPSR